MKRNTFWPLAPYLERACSTVYIPHTALRKVQYTKSTRGRWEKGAFRVGHRVLLRSEHIVLLRSFKERNVLLHSFFESLATYETQKNGAFFCILFLRT